MFRKRAVWLFVALSVVMVSGVAMAFGGHGGRGGDRAMFVLARAAGLTKAQIRTAFKNDSANLKTDRTNLKTARQALASCLVSGADCSSQASAFLSAKQALATETLSVWQGLFKGNPNPQNAAKVLGQLQQLQQQRMQIFQQAFAGGGQ